MPKFYNIIPGKDSDAILLYGYIGDWGEVTPRDVITEILQATYSGRKIDVRINSNGGEVAAGIAIFNALRNSKADITIYIDGIAASIASVIAACGKPVQMSKYARLMVHCITGGVCGGAEEMQETAQQIISLENDLAEIYATRLGITADEVKQTYFDGEDHWLTADDALRLGFIDAIYDTDPIDINMAPNQVYEYYLNKFNTKFLNKTHDKMIDVKKRFGLPETATEADVIAKIDEMDARTAALTEKDATITELTNKLTAYTQKEATANETAITALVEKAVKENKINDSQKAHFVNILKADRTSGEAIINGLQPMRKAMNVIYSTDGVPAEGPMAKRQREINEKNKK